MGYLTCAWNGTQLDWSGTGAVLQAVLTGIAIWASIMVVDRQHSKQVAFAKSQETDQLKQKVEKSLVERVGRIAAVSTELQICADQCEIYVVQFIEQNWYAPAYRLPTVAFDKIWPMLLAEGKLTDQAIKDVTQFYTDATSFNRSLDRIDQLKFERPVSDPASENLVIDLIRSEAGRALMKAVHLIPQNSPKRAICEKHLAKLPSRFDPALAQLDMARTNLQHPLVV